MFKNSSLNQIGLKHTYKDKTFWLTTFNNEICKEINFDFPIKQVIQFNNKVFIRIEPSVGEVFNENIYCFSQNGILLWQVKPINYMNLDCPYTNMVIQDDKLISYNWCGEKMHINLESGEIVDKKFTK